MKKSRIVIILLFSIAIFLSIRATYAYYVDQTEAKSELSVANWLIKLNGDDITMETSKTFSLSEMNYKTYDVTANGKKVKNSNNKFAPGMEAYFTIELDATETMVALEYDVDIDLSGFDDPNIIIKDYEVDNGSMYKTSEGLYHGKMELSNVQSKKTTMKFTLEWLDNEDYVDEDLKLGSTANTSIKMPVSVQVKQYS